uniref:ARAD1B11704p n=1 Tax=Blastobotrys adeninivorans TaxID=409370 RepID=A0A060T5Z1_BLAAD
MSTQDSESSNRPRSPLEGDEKESKQLQELKEDFAKLYDEWNTVNSRQKKQFLLLSNGASQLDENEYRVWEKYKIELIEKCNTRAWTRLDDEGVEPSLDSTRKPELRSPRSASLQGSDMDVPARKRGKYTWDPEK